MTNDKSKKKSRERLKIDARKTTAREAPREDEMDLTSPWDPCDPGDVFDDEADHGHDEHGKPL